jgi:hypothetical protein
MLGALFSLCFVMLLLVVRARVGDAINDTSPSTDGLAHSWISSRQYRDFLWPLVHVFNMLNYRHESVGPSRPRDDVVLHVSSDIIAHYTSRQQLELHTRYWP